MNTRPTASAMSTFKSYSADKTKGPSEPKLADLVDSYSIRTFSVLVHLKKDNCQRVCSGNVWVNLVKFSYIWFIR